jgi:ribosomal protein S18 acetylase RimI-like enzyme
MPPPLRRAAAFGVTYRTLREDDLPFIAALYASTRTEELAVTGWPDEVKSAFLEQQHRAQHHFYQANYPGAEWLIVEQDGAGIGRLYLQQRETDIRLIDIALLPAFRRAGIGGAMIGDLLEWAGALSKSISLHVEPNNPVRPLYVRLGFESLGLAGAYEAMQWQPEGGQTTT